MKPYTSDKHTGSPKFKAEKTDHVGGYSKGVSKFDKLMVKNANRSRKKTKRQEGKKLIKKSKDYFPNLYEIYYEIDDGYDD